MLAPHTAGPVDGVEDVDEGVEDRIVGGGAELRAHGADVVVAAAGRDDGGGAARGGADGGSALATDGWVEEQVLGEGDGEVAGVGVAEEWCVGGEG